MSKPYPTAILAGMILTLGASLGLPTTSFAGTTVPETEQKSQKRPTLVGRFKGWVESRKTNKTREMAIPANPVQGVARPSDPLADLGKDVDGLILRQLDNQSLAAVSKTDHYRRAQANAILNERYEDALRSRPVQLMKSTDLRLGERLIQHLAKHPQEKAYLVRGKELGIPPFILIPQTETYGFREAKALCRSMGAPLPTMEQSFTIMEAIETSQDPSKAFKQLLGGRTGTYWSDGIEFAGPELRPHAEVFVYSNISERDGRGDSQPIREAAQVQCVISDPKL